MKKDKEWLSDRWDDLTSNVTGRNRYYDGYDKALMDIEPFIDQLDEPELPVIPQFVASAIEKTKENRKDITILNIFNEVTTSGFYTERVDDWVLNNPDVFTRAWLDGYTIEKEPEKLYRVKFPNVTKHGNEMYLEKNYGEDVTSIDWSPKGFVENEDPNDYLFTEQEIKAIDERYWAFREEVPNV